MQTIHNDCLRFDFLETGDLYQSKIKDKNIHLFRGNEIDGSYSNIYLKVFQQDQVFVTPLLGRNADSVFFSTPQSSRWVGTFRHISYEVTFHIQENQYYYHVNLSGQGTCALYFCTDISLGYDGNEAYIGQYIDHRVLSHDGTFTALSRQNQPQKGQFPMIQLGGTTLIESYCTDGFQFYGRDYKVTQQIQGLWEDQLESRVYQYEFPLICLKTVAFTVEDTFQTCFYGAVFENSAPNQDMVQVTIPACPVLTDPWEEHPKIPLLIDPRNVLVGQSVSEAQLQHDYPTMSQKEYEDGQLLSFFSNEKHVVLKEKESLVERQHGHILRSTTPTLISEELLSTTCYMSGIFNAHTVMGNTNMNLFLSFVRNPLNIGKINGQRIYVRLNGQYQLLAEPSFFEMGLQHCKWVYVLTDDTLVVTTATKVGDPVVALQVTSEKNKCYDFIVTQQLAMGTDEYGPLTEVFHTGNEYAFSFHSDTECAKRYPELQYFLHLEDAIFTGDEIFYADGKTRMAHLKCLQVQQRHTFTLEMSASLHGERPCVPFSFSAEMRRAQDYFTQLLHGFHLSNNGKAKDEVEKLNQIAYWYAHNAMVHYTMPHGLEQYGGAAWGTRDVCQGPMEFFMATQNFTECHDLLKKIYAYQMWEDGAWSQWFMFDRYQYLQMGESHGDVIVWPAKALAMYILATGDYGILDEKVPYVLQKQQYDFTTEVYTIGQHLEKQLDYIVAHFYPGTCLSKYGGGDWDDTLQPYEESLRDQMVSGWTTSLTYEVFGQLEKVFAPIDENKSKQMRHLKAQLLKDYNQYIIQDGVAAGFISFSEPGKTQCILHPTDDHTHIRYRLLPMTRSIIAQLFTKAQAEKHIQLIEDHMYYADGVRLMSDPPTYKGGRHTYFVRAESATNFGREIGLNYIHADIRYVEAMTVFGKSDIAMNTMLKINPINIQDSVKNAERRQSNCYFSSSDANFYTRYEAADHFYQLRCGEMSVKGGWRIYSSGPGIYIYQLIARILGVRFEENNLVLDPTLPDHYDKTTLDFTIYGKPVSFHYAIQQGGSKVTTVLLDGKALPFTRMENPYRVGGVTIQQQDIVALLKDHSCFEIVIS